MIRLYPNYYYLDISKVIKGKAEILSDEKI